MRQLRETIKAGSINKFSVLKVMKCWTMCLFINTPLIKGLVAQLVSSNFQFGSYWINVIKDSVDLPSNGKAFVSPVEGLVVS